MCPKHKNHQGTRAPKVDCLGCWKVYVQELEGLRADMKDYMKDYLVSTSRLADDIRADLKTI